MGAVDAIPPPPPFAFLFVESLQRPRACDNPPPPDF